MNNERWGDEQVGGSEDYLKKNKDGGEGDRSPRNETFKENLAKLENFVMLSFSVSGRMPLPVVLAEGDGG